jgi:hypothetical protein
MTVTEKPSKVRLAEAMAEVPGMPPYMLQRATDGYYHDFESELAFPEIQLVADLREMARLPTTGPKAKRALSLLAERVIDGEFDATKAESDAWARSEEGRAVFNELFSHRNGE